MYSSGMNSHINYQHLSDDSEVNMVTTNVNRNRIIDEATRNEAGHLELANDFSNGGNIQIVNYLPSDMLHHQMVQNVKKIEVNYKDQLHVYEGGSSTIITQSHVPSQLLPVLTPIKYNEYHSNIVSDIINEDSDKSDCESGDHELHKTPSKLPHKKRIAKNLNQPYNQHEQFSIIIPNDESNLRNMQTTTNHFECNICGAVILDQLNFFVHLKQHYEPHSIQEKRIKESQELEATQEVGMLIPVAMSEKIQEVLDYSQEGIKNEEIPREPLPEIDEFNEFSEPEDMMEDLRKEVDKVVETIEDNECMPEATWNYQVTEEIEEPTEQPEDLQLYTENLIQSNANSIDTAFDELDNTQHSEMARDTRDFESEDEEDNKPLEQVRRSLQTPSKYDNSSKKFPPEDDKDDLELTECLKKIHNFKCASCNKAFNSRTALGYHLKTHTTERRYVCDQCGKKFLTNGALKVHQRLHTDDRPYECKFPDCGKSFRQWGDLKYHETSIHSNKKDHVCEFCAKAFARKYSLVIHRRIHTGERNYKCTDCDKSFRASSYLLNHKRIHTGEKPYCCSVSTCLKKFRVVGDLKRHMKIHDRTKSVVIKEKKKEVPVTVKRKEVPIEVPLKKLPTNDECIDLRFKDKSALFFSNNEIDIFAKRGRSAAAESVKSELSSSKAKKPVKSKKPK